MEDQNNLNQQQVGADNTPAPQDNIIEAPVVAKKNVLTIVFGVLAFVFAAAALFFGIKYFKDKPTNESNTDNDGTVVTQNEGNGNSNGNGTSNNTAPTYQNVTELVRGVMSKLDNYTGDVRENFDIDQIAYKFDGTETFVPLNHSFEASVRATDAGSILSKLGSNLADAGFNSIGKIPFRGSAGHVLNGYFNSDMNVVCAVFDGGDDVYLECAEVDWDWLTNEKKALIRSLIAAYRGKVGKNIGILYGWDNEAKNGYGTYQRITVAMDGGLGEFYRVNPESEWQFFYAGQAYADCDDYDTEDLKKAFYGVQCYSGNAISTVQL